MKTFFLWPGAWAALLTTLGGTWFSPLLAQVAPGDQIPAVQPVLKQPGLDDVDNDPTQLLTWVCRYQDKEIAVETKEIKGLQQLMNANAEWQCAQNIPTIPDGSLSFSCESGETLNLLTVYWIKGTGSRSNMKDWMNALADSRQMVCTARRSNLFWE